MSHVKKNFQILIFAQKLFLVYFIVSTFSNSEAKTVKNLLKCENFKEKIEQAKATLKLSNPKKLSLL